jgi:iron(III) transport system substrate-binding protein
MSTRLTAVAAAEELVVYSTIFAGYAERMVQEFEARNPGVTVHVINPGGTEAMIARLIAERDNPRADIMHSGGSTEYAFAKSQGILQPVDLGDIGIPAEIPLGSGMLPTRDPENYYFSWAVLFSGIMVNTERLSELNLPAPTSYKDLTNPIYKGQIVSPNPLLSSTAMNNVLATIQAYGPDEVWELWDGINANIGLYSDSTSNTYNLVNRGEFAIGIVNNRPVFEYQMQGWPVEFIFPRDGAMVQDNAVGVVNGAKNPELAKKFIEFLLGEDMQRIGAEYPYTPIRPGVLDADNFVALENMAKQIDVLLLPDPEQAEASRGIIQEKFEGYIRQR